MFLNEIIFLKKYIIINIILLIKYYFLILSMLLSTFTTLILILFGTDYIISLKFLLRNIFYQKSGKSCLYRINISDRNSVKKHSRGRRLYEYCHFKKNMTVKNDIYCAEIRVRFRFNLIISILNQRLTVLSEQV